MFDKFPRTNIPDMFASWADFENFVKLLDQDQLASTTPSGSGGTSGRIRSFRTLEMRICDIPMRVDETLAIAALIQATVAKLYKLHSRNQGFRMYSRALIMENKWRASRYGLDGMLIDFGRETRSARARADPRIPRLRGRRAGRARIAAKRSSTCRRFSIAAPAPIANCSVFEQTDDLQESRANT